MPLAIVVGSCKSTTQIKSAAHPPVQRNSKENLLVVVVTANLSSHIQLTRSAYECVHLHRVHLHRDRLQCVHSQCVHLNCVHLNARTYLQLSATNGVELRRQPIADCVKFVLSPRLINATTRDALNNVTRVTQSFKCMSRVRLSPKAAENI